MKPRESMDSGDLGGVALALKDTAERLVRQIRRLRPDITCFYEYLPAETHATSLHISLYDAMRLLNTHR